MKHLFLTVLLLCTSLFAELKHEYLSQKLIDSKIPIVDIRTKTEWKETGILKDSIPITFYNEKGQYDLKGFITELNEKVDTTKPFALICRVGTRTRIVSSYLANTLNYNVVNIAGGIMIHNMNPKPRFVQYR